MSRYGELSGEMTRVRKTIERCRVRCPQLTSVVGENDVR